MGRKGLYLEIMSSKKPTLQNIPLRTETGRKLRDAFTQKGPHVEVDYGAIERWFAQGKIAEEAQLEYRRAAQVVANRIGAIIEESLGECFVELPEGWTWDTFVAEIDREIEHAKFLRRNAEGRPPWTSDGD